MDWTSELQELELALAKLAGGFEHFGYQGHVDEESLRHVLSTVATRMRDNYPYHSAMYAGQMLKPPHPVARIAYAMSLWINPNNHALDGGRASSAMEKECIRDIAGMFGWSDPLGHLTSGGTMANLEALWIAGSLAPDCTVLASNQAHYTHQRISQVLKLPFRSVASAADGTMDLTALETELQKGGVGVVVATLGTTGLGAVDDLPGILALQTRYAFRVHVDAAYGGYFAIASRLKPTVAKRYAAMSQADSIVIDPHKHGLQPYGCGCVLFRDPAVGRFYKHDSAYTYFSSDELHLGEISLECSRAGAAAVALWATHQLLPPKKNSEFSQMLDACLATAETVGKRLDEHPDFVALQAPSLDIVVYSVIGGSLAEISHLNQQIFDRGAERGLHLALYEVPANQAAKALGLKEQSTERVRVLRSVFMKPEQENHIDEFFRLLDNTLNCVRQSVDEQIQSR